MKFRDSFNGLVAPLLISAYALLTGCGESSNTTTSPQASYIQTNLVASSPIYHAQILEPNLIDAWGIAIRPAGLGGHFWVTANKTGISYEYVGDVGGVPLYQDGLKEISVPGSDPSSTGSPTGTVFNGGKNFVITQNHPNGAITAESKFLFATDTGTISAWTERKNANGSFDRAPNALKVIDYSVLGSAFFGLAMSSNFDRLFVADFGVNPVIREFDGYFNDVTNSVAFRNPFIAGLTVQAGEVAPFNIQVLHTPSGQDHVFVMYAKTQADTQHAGSILGGSEVHCQGCGKLAEFDLYGNLLAVWDDAGLLNAPWGITYATKNFGPYSNYLLVSNFGNGSITVFDPVSKKAVGILRDSANKPIINEGIWGLQFGNGASLGGVDSLYFAAGPKDETEGLFGKLEFKVSK
ncbi:MAG: TIGR03118 family protein [Aquirhabdus sp.]